MWKDGTYYSFIFLDKTRSSELLGEDTFKSEGDAIQYARENKALLFKHVFENGKDKNYLNSLLYNPLPEMHKKRIGV